MLIMIVLIGSQKGGCGKSTVAVNICAQFAINEMKVVLVDADQQGTASNWAADRLEDLVLSRVDCIQRHGNISASLLELKAGYEHVVVDVGARDNTELRTGMSVADILIVPLRPSQPDLDTLANLSKVIVRAKKLNPELRIHALLTMTSTNPRVREIEETQDYLKDYPDIQVLHSTIKDRKIYRDAMGEGLGVAEMNNQKAKAEVEHIMEELFHDQT